MIPGAQRFAGDRKRPAPLASLTSDSLEVRDGCAVVLQWNENEGFVGGTQGTACRSDLRGATYATSEVSITSDRLVSWDRGFDESGEQMWGAREAGYIFLKLASPAEKPVK